MTKLGFIGAGNMAGAIIHGLIANGFEPSNLIICCRTESKLAVFEALGCAVTTDLNSLIEQSEAVLLAVKPQGLKEVCLSIADSVQAKKPLILSVVAAIPAGSIGNWLGGDLAIIRTMPNTPSLVAAGATGLYANTLTNQNHRAFTEQVFNSIGQSCWVDKEALLHSVTATAGSAPAYFFRFAEAMTKVALAQGLNDEQARMLIGQTMLGAAKMVLETDEPISQMCKNVCSPNGTTERAIMSFEENEIDTVVANAMQACFNRSIELSDLLAD